MDIWQWVAKLWLQEVLFLRRLEAFNLTREPRGNVASGQGNNAERGNSADERDNPMGEANSHYRLLRKQYKLLKGSLNEVVKHMEGTQKPAPSLGVVGHAGATPDSPGMVCPGSSHNTKQCQTPAQTGVPLHGGTWCSTYHHVQKLTAG